MFGKVYLKIDGRISEDMYLKYEVKQFCYQYKCFVNVFVCLYMYNELVEDFIVGRVYKIL